MQNNYRPAERIGTRMNTKNKRHTTRQIDKVKITDKGTGVLIVWTETILTERKTKGSDVLGEDRNKLEHIVTGDFAPHQDLLDAFAMLRKPVLDICELPDYGKLESYRCTGVSFSGEQDEATVVITAVKTAGWSGKAFAFNTPATPLQDNDQYTGSELLDKFCKAIVTEAWEYVNGKHAIPAQMELELQPLEA